MTHFFYPTYGAYGKVKKMSWLSEKYLNCQDNPVFLKYPSRPFLCFISCHRAVPCISAKPLFLLWNVSVKINSFSLYDTPFMSGRNNVKSQYQCSPTDVLLLCSKLLFVDDIRYFFDFCRQMSFWYIKVVEKLWN